MQNDPQQYPSGKQQLYPPTHQQEYPHPDSQYLPQKFPYPYQAKSSVGNLDNNIAALLCYLFCPITSLIFLFTEPKTNRFLRFHAIQSLITLIGGFAIMMLSSLLMLFLGSLLAIIGGKVGVILAVILIGGCYLTIIVTSMVFLVVSILCMVKAFHNELWQMPLVGKLAARIANS